MIFAFTVERVAAARRVARLIDFFTFLPLISPPFTTSIAFVFSFGPRGLITYDLLGMKSVQVYGLTSTFAAETLTYFPIAYLALRPMLASISTSFEEAAFSLGGSRWHAFRTVTLPLVIPALANAFLLLFGCSLADFATPLILAGSDFSVLPTEAYLQITGMFDLKSGAILSLLLLVPAGLVFYAQERLVAGRSYVTVTGKAAVAAPHDSVSTAAGLALLAFCILISALILYFYLLLFYASIVLAFGANHTLTLEHYRVIFTEGLPAIRGHPDHRADRHAARRALRHRGRLPRRTHEVPRPQGDGGGQHAELRAARHHRRHRLSAGLQRRAAGADGHRDHPDRLLRVPLQPDRNPHHHRAAAADRQEHGGSLRRASAPAIS